MKFIRKILIFLIFIIISIIIVNYHNYLEGEKSTTVKIGIIDAYIPESILYNKNVKNINYTNLTDKDIKNNHGLITLQLVMEQCNDADVYYVSVLNEKNTCKIDTIISGIEWCIEQDVDIICMSLATTNNNNELEKIIKSAIDKDIIIVSSCINFSEIECYPAMYQNVISVSEGAKRDASVILSNKTFFAEINNKTIEIKGTSALTAYVSGFILKELSTGNNEIDEILKKIK